MLRWGNAVSDTARTLSQLRYLLNEFLSAFQFTMADVVKRAAAQHHLFAGEASLSWRRRGHDTRIPLKGFIEL